MKPDDAERRQRAAARAARMTVSKPGEAGAEPTRLSPEESVSLVYELTKIAWSLSGKPFPSYTRATMPVRWVSNKAD